MSTEQTQDWVHRLQAGMLELFDLKNFENLRIDDLAHELSGVYRVRFLESHKGGKQEIGLAQDQSGSKRWPTRQLNQCLLLTSEGQVMTGMAVMTHIRLRPARKKEGMLELSSGGGYSVYHDLDGWRIKLLQERTVSLTPKSLTKRGWLLMNGVESARSKH